MSSGKVTILDDVICVIDNSSVYKGNYGAESVAVAVKVEKNPNMEHLDRNLKVLLNVKHDNIVQVIEQYTLKGAHYLVTERFTGLNIFQYVQSINSPFKRNKIVQQIAKQIVNALIYLHYNKIFCNGIKPGGIVITQLPPDGSSKEIEEQMPLIVKLIDFSGSIIFNRGMDERLLKYSKFYAAPELLTGAPSKAYTVEPDIYALGVLIHFLLSGQPLEKNADGNGMLSSAFNSQFHDAADFITNCTMKNTLDRPTAKDLLQHPFIQQNKKKINLKRLQKHYGTPNLKKFDMTSKILGKGGFGEVRLGFVKKTDVPIALKIIRVKNADLMALEREIGITMSLNHPHICKCYGFELDWLRIYIGVELAEGGDLQGYLLSLDRFTEADASELIKQILEALVYLEQQNVGHYDLKPENILIKNVVKPSSGGPSQNTQNNGETGILETNLQETQNCHVNPLFKQNSKPVLLLADFGTAVLREQFKDETIICGTPQYIAPEVLLHEKGFNTQPDIYALAAIAYVICTGEFPFTGANNLDVMRAQIGGNWNKATQTFLALSEECKDFITKAFTQDWKKRPKASQLIKHKFITNPNKSNILNSINILKAARNQANQ